MQKIIPFLWFDTQAEEAALYYTSIFPEAKISEISRYNKAGAKVSGRPAGSAMTVNFMLAGQNFTALNGGPVFKFNESVSFVVTCKNQKEIDYYWEKLSSYPKAEQCGWCKDKFGLSWQIIPENLGNLLKNPHAMQAMLSMKKIVIADLK